MNGSSPEDTPAHLVGCCGWPEARSRYFEHFPVMEVQQTFYEPPSVALATKWRSAAPESFRFCVKAWQLITHTYNRSSYRKLRSALSPQEYDLVGSFRPTEQVWLAWERTLAVARALQADIILFQCPASFRPDSENVRNFRSFFSQVERSDHLLAWEPRGEWPATLVQTLCQEFDLLHCVDPFTDQSTHGTPTYWRLHGRGSYSYQYSDEELNELKTKLLDVEASGKVPAYVFFNNVRMRDDALRFQAMLTERTEGGPIAPIQATGD